MKVLICSYRTYGHVYTMAHVVALVGRRLGRK